MHKKPMIEKGWLRIVIYIVTALLLSFLIASICSVLFNLKGLINRWEKLGNIEDLLPIYLINNSGFIIAAFALRILVDKKSIASLGFTWKGFSQHAFAGFCLAIFLLSIGTLILLSFDYLSYTGFQFSLQQLLLQFLLFAIVAFSEETIIRGYILNNLMQSFNKWIALLISAALFAVLHATNPNVSLLSITAIFIAGILLGINYIYTKNLWFAIFLHFAWNFFQGPILGYEVSGIKTNKLFIQSLTGPEIFTGGNFGFEGSAICVLLEIMAILFLFKGYEHQKNQYSKTLVD